jgi:hypothetical protein
MVTSITDRRPASPADTAARVECMQCGAEHPAEFRDVNQYGQKVWTVVCTEDWLTDYYTDEVVFVVISEEYAEYDDVPCCSICDGAGHGYPGGGPCPLEVSDLVRWETDEDERRALMFA